MRGVDRGCTGASLEGSCRSKRGKRADAAEDAILQAVIDPVLENRPEITRFLLRKVNKHHPNCRSDGMDWWCVRGCPHLPLVTP
jgi:hypothetical protein